MSEDARAMVTTRYILPRYIPTQAFAFTYAYISLHTKQPPPSLIYEPSIYPSPTPVPHIHPIYPVINLRHRPSYSFPNFQNTNSKDHIQNSSPSIVTVLPTTHMKHPPPPNHATLLAHPFTRTSACHTTRDAFASASLTLWIRGAPPPPRRVACDETCDFPAASARCGLC